MTRSSAQAGAGGPDGGARVMGDAVVRWLERLHDEQLTAALEPFAVDERRNWGYVPGVRRGVALSDMTRVQSKAALELLASGLSPHAFAQAVSIAGLEDVLDTLEGGRRNRHRGDYWVVVFGDPTSGAPWSWRFEGHHLSLTHTIVEGEAARGTPVFFGANPARLAHNGNTVLEPLAAEEHLAFALLAALDTGQRRRAVVSDTPPSDILTGDAPEVPESWSWSGAERSWPAQDRDGTVQDHDGDMMRDDLQGGIALGELAGEAGDLALQLVDLYLHRLPHDLVATSPGRAAIEGVRFAWAGRDRPGLPHYYRLVGPRLLIELDNTQNDANHVHTVVRDPRGDFGGDLLRNHLADAHSRLHG